MGAAVFSFSPFQLPIPSSSLPQAFSTLEKPVVPSCTSQQHPVPSCFQLHWRVGRTKVGVSFRQTAYHDSEPTELELLIGSGWAQKLSQVKFSYLNSSVSDYRHLILATAQNSPMNTGFPIRNEQMLWLTQTRKEVTFGMFISINRVLSPGLPQINKTQACISQLSHCPIKTWH